MTRQHQKLLLRMVALVLAMFCVLEWATSEADTGLLQDEWTEGSSRFCLYDAAGRTVIITVEIQDLCPMQVEV